MTRREPSNGIALALIGPGRATPLVEAAKKYIHPDRFSILVVGPREGKDRPLSEYGEVRTVDISIPELPVAKQG